MTEMYRFETKNFTIVATIHESEYPDTSWMSDDQIEDYRNGRLVFFDTKVSVIKNGKEVGWDVLCESSYYAGTEAKFFTAHRDPDPMARNCTIMRAAKGKNAVVCHYFPSMVWEAIKDARQTLEL